VTASLRLDGRRALVTGGASGIGAATTALLRERGAVVVTVDLRGGDITADVRDEQSIAAAFTAAAGHLGAPPDLVVTAAGIYRIAPAVDTTVAEWNEVLEINLRGTFLTAREAARTMTGGGAIVTIASTAALQPDADEPTAHYNASKAGVVAITKQLAVELAPRGIRVNTICPGVIDTPMLRMMDDPVAGEAFLREGVPLRRLGRPAEVAETIAFLASNAASYITGVAVPVDGGLSL
jgi:NAD(P)-dependent dehydrogenase (short-subunit alcohol dehydrogenase family)